MTVSGFPALLQVRYNRHPGFRVPDELFASFQEQLIPFSSRHRQHINRSNRSNPKLPHAGSRLRD
jgi:hypothetical protein